MIRVMLELCPGGFVDDPERLGEIEIINDVTLSIETKGRRGRYHYSLEKKIKGRVVTTGVVEYPRVSRHPWELVRRILNDAHEQGKL